MPCLCYLQIGLKLYSFQILIYKVKMKIIIISANFLEKMISQFLLIWAFFSVNTSLPCFSFPVCTKRSAWFWLLFCFCCLSFSPPPPSNGIGYFRSNASCAADVGKLKSSDEWENQTDAVEGYVWHCCEVAKVMIREKTSLKL